MARIDDAFAAGGIRALFFYPLIDFCGEFTGKVIHSSGLFSSSNSELLGKACVNRFIFHLIDKDPYSTGFKAIFIGRTIISSSFARAARENMTEEERSWKIKNCVASTLATLTAGALLGPQAALNTALFVNHLFSQFAQEPLD